MIAKSDLAHPVLSVPPDTRRSVVLRAEQLAAMGINTGDLRGRAGREVHYRWWYGWTVAAEIEALTVLSPHRAHREALADYLLEVSLLVNDVRVSVSPAAPATHLEAIAAISTEVTAACLLAGPEQTSSNGTTARVKTDIPAYPSTSTLMLPAVIDRLDRSTATALRKRLASYVDTMRTALSHGPLATLNALHFASHRVHGEKDLQLLLHGLELASLTSGRVLRMNAREVMAEAGRALLTLSDEAAWARVARQGSVERSAAMSLGMLGWSPADILALQVDDIGPTASQLPPPAQWPLRALEVCRREIDEADETNAAFDAGPAGRPLTLATIRRWIGLLGPDFSVPTPTRQGTLRESDASSRLARYGLEWRHA